MKQLKKKIKFLWHYYTGAWLLQECLGSFLTFVAEYFKFASWFITSLFSFIFNQIKSFRCDKKAKFEQ